MVDTSGVGNSWYKWTTGGFGSIYFGSSNATLRGFIEYAHQTDSMQFGTNLAGERLRITSGGLIGIGTNNPSGKLNIVGNTQLLNLIQDSGDLAIRLNDRGHVLLILNFVIIHQGHFHLTLRWIRKTSYNF